MDLPAEFVNARALPPAAHLEMQAMLQSSVDSAITRMINVPQDFAFDAFRDLYHAAMETWPERLYSLSARSGNR